MGRWDELFLLPVQVVAVGQTAWAAGHVGSARRATILGHGDKARGHRVRIEELVRVAAGDLADRPPALPRVLRHVRRHDAQEVSPRVTYSISEYGRTLVPLVAQLCG